MALLAIAGVAFAAGGGSKGVILCVAKPGGAISLPEKGGCGKGKQKLVLSKQGPAGAAGTAGAPGPAGPAGKPANLSSEAHPVTAAVENCAAAPGALCGSPGVKGTWETGSEGLTYRKDPGGLVHLSGAVGANESGSGVQFGEVNTIFYLPPGYRPTDGIHRFYMSRSSCHNPGSIYYFDVMPNGAVQPEVPAGCLSLNTAVFRP